MTFYSLHGLFFCYNLILQYFLLIPGVLFNINSDAGKIVFSIFFICFSMCLSNILVIPTFEFLTFPYLKYRNPLCHLISFYYIYKQKKFNYENLIPENPISTFLIFLYLAIIGLLYSFAILISLFGNEIRFKDFLKCIILFLVYLNYLTIFMNYFFLSLYLIWKILRAKEKEKVFIDTIEMENFEEKVSNNENEFIMENKKTKNKYALTIYRNDNKEPEKYKIMIESHIKKEMEFCTFKGFNLYFLSKINAYFKDKPHLPDVNLVSYIIEPYIISNYYKGKHNANENDKNHLEELDEYYFEDVCFNIGIYVKIIVLLSSIIILPFTSIFEISFESFSYFFLLFITILIISLAFNFPNCYKNRKTFGEKVWSPKYKLDEKRYKPRNPNILSLARIVSDLLMLLVLIGLIIVYIFMKDDNNNTEDFPDFSPNEIKSDIDT